MNCHEIDELAAAYALSALDVDEREAVLAHLATCDAHLNTFAQLQGMSELLPLSTYELEPSPRLRESISRMIRIDASAAETPVVKTVPAVRRIVEERRPAAPMWGFLQRGFAAVAVALVLSVIGFGAYQAFFAPANANIFERNLSNSTGATARIVYFEGHDLAIVHTEGLAPLPDGQIYQLWSMADGQAVNRGVLSNLTAGSGVSVIFGDIPRKEPCFVTIESSPVSQPTGPKVLTTDSIKQ